MAKALALAGFFYEDVGLMKSKKGGLILIDVPYCPYKNQITIYNLFTLTLY